MKRILILIGILFPLFSLAQSIGYLRYDTVKIYKNGGSAELVLMNSTRDSVGILTNIGGGKTKFIKTRKINDSTLVIGLDTVVVGSGGGSSSVITDATLTGNGTSGDPLGADTVNYIATKTDLPFLLRVQDTLSLSTTPPNASGLVYVDRVGLFRFTGTFPLNGNKPFRAPGGYWEQIRGFDDKDFYVDNQVVVPYDAGAIIIGNSISMAGSIAYTTFQAPLNRIIGGVFTNYSVAGSSVTTMGQMLRNNQIPRNHRQITIYNNGVNDIRNSAGSKTRVLQASRSFLATSFRDTTIDASAATVISGTWASYNALTSSPISKTDGRYTTEYNATLRFDIGQFNNVGGVYIQFISSHKDSALNRSDSVLITDDLGNTIGVVNTNKATNVVNGAAIGVFFNINVTSASQLRIINRTTDTLVVDYVGILKKPGSCLPAFVNAITKVSTSALQPGIGHEFWDEVNDTVRYEVSRWIRQGYPAVFVDFNKGFYPDSATYMTEYVSDPPNAIHPTTFAHREVFTKRLLERMILQPPANNETYNVPNASFHLVDPFRFSGNVRFIILPTISQNSTLQIPAAVLRPEVYYKEGQEIVLINGNTNASFRWTLTSANIVNPGGGTTTTLFNETSYRLVFTQGVFRLISRSTNRAHIADIATTGDGLIMRLDDDYLNRIESTLSGAAVNHVMRFILRSNTVNTTPVILGADSTVRLTKYVNVNGAVDATQASNLPWSYRAVATNPGLRFALAGETSRFSDISSGFSSTQSSNYIDFNVANGTTNTTFRPLRLRGDSSIIAYRHFYFDNLDSAAGSAPHVLAISPTTKKLFKYALSQGNPRDTVTAAIDAGVAVSTSPFGSGFTYDIRVNSTISSSAITTNTALNASREATYLVDATSGNITLTLPSASSNGGYRMFIKRIDNSANTVTVSGINANDINTIAGYGALQVQAQNVLNTWFVISKY